MIQFKSLSLFIVYYEEGGKNEATKGRWICT